MMRFLVLGAAVFVLNACASMSREQQFGPVREAVSGRLGVSPYWHSTTNSEANISAVVDSILSNELTAQAAVQVAMLNNRGLQSVYENLGIAQSELVQAGLLQNPVLSGALNIGLNGIGTGYEIGIAQQFMSILQIPMRKRLARSSFERVRLEVSDYVLDLAARTEAAFYTYQASEQRRELIATTVEATRLGAEMASRQYDAGNISSIDLANERALYEQTRLTLIEAESEVVENRELLGALMGLFEADANWTVSKRLPGIPVDTLKVSGLETIAVEQRLDLAAAQQQILLTGQSAGVERVNLLVPTFEVGVDFERESSGDKVVKPGIGIRIPIFDQGRALSSASRSRIRQAQENYAMLATQIRSDVRRYYARMQNARTRAEHLYKVVLPLRSKITAESQLLYNGMYIGVFQLLQAKRDEIAAGQQYVEALEDYWLAHAALTRTVGGRLPYSIESAPDDSMKAEPRDSHEHHKHENHHNHQNHENQPNKQNQPQTPEHHEHLNSRVNSGVNRDLNSDLDNDLNPVLNSEVN